MIWLDLHTSPPYMVDFVSFYGRGRRRMRVYNITDYGVTLGGSSYTGVRRIN